MNLNFNKFKEDVSFFADLIIYISMLTLSIVQ